jgi:tetratricopeptide (TPR) repeat protein
MKSLFLSLLFVISGCFLSSAEYLSFAEHLFEEGDYLRAISEYKRLKYFSVSKDSSEFYQFRIGTCYLKRGEYKKAKRVFDNLVLEDVEDPYLERSIVISSSICSIKMGDIEYAKIGLVDRMANEEVCDSCHYLIGICHLKEKKWNDARDEFKRIEVDGLRDKGLEKLEKTSNAKFKSPKVALWLSTFIPGAGQIYSGKIFQGIVSFSLNVSLGYLTYKAAREDRNMDAFLILYFGVQRFYFGNLNQAQRYSKEYNRNIIKNISIE